MISEAAHMKNACTILPVKLYVRIISKPVLSYGGAILFFSLHKASCSTSDRD